MNQYLGTKIQIKCDQIKIRNKMINHLKLSFAISSLLVLFFLPQTILTAQEKIVKDSTNIKVNLRTPILPYENKKFYSLEDEFATIISELKKEVFLNYEIKICIEVDTTIEIHDSGSKNALITNLNQINHYNEAIVINQVTIDQEEIQLEDQTGYFAKKNETYSNNFLTTLTFFSYLLNTKSGENLGTFDFELIEIGKTKELSRKMIIKAFKKKIKNELKRFYWFSAEIDSSKNGIITIPLGAEHGIKKGMEFELIEPERTWIINEEEVSTPSQTVALVSVIDTSKESSQLKYLRKWNDHHEGSWVLEHFNPIYGIEAFCIPPVANSYFNLGILLHGGPIHSLDFGGGTHFLKIADSFNDHDYGLGFSGFIIWRFINKPGFDFGSRLGLTLDIPFKKDDLGVVALTTVFSLNIGFIAEFPISKELDLVINTGYRIGKASEDWNYSEDDETYPATWDKGPPKVENSGFMLLVGFKYILF